MKKLNKFLIVVIIGLFAIVFNTTAQLVTVTSNADSGQGSLREAVSTDTTIEFAPGITSITLTSGQIGIYSSVTINGGTGTTRVAIYNGGSDSRIFWVYRSGTLTINNFILANGNFSSSGGAIGNIGTFIANNCNFNNNIAGSGGAVLSMGSSTGSQNNYNYLYHCTFEGNSVIGTLPSFSGGAIYISSNVTTPTLNSYNCLYGYNPVGKYNTNSQVGGTITAGNNLINGSTGIF